MERTQVGIIGAGPAGLVLSHLLAGAGIDTVVLESRSREYVEGRVRAGVLEAGTVSVLERVGVADRLRREGLVHEGVNLSFNGDRHRIDLAGLTGKTVTVYGQTEVVRDLVGARLAADLPLRFEAAAVAIDDATTDRPVVHYETTDGPASLSCDVVAGCDGFWGMARPTIPAPLLTTYERDHPYAWLGILARVAPSSDELIYAFHDHGFALSSLRSPEISRLYLQVAPDENLDEWPDTRIWDELHIRLATDGWELHEGPVFDKGITPMRSYVAGPMRHGRVFLAGDAAHIVPPTGAKGLNLAVADVTILAEALMAWYADADETGVDRYSDRCQARVWRAQEFATEMTTLLHLDPSADAFTRRIQRARQEQVCTSRAAATLIAENYVGLPL
ncbi:MAG: 4-hydroxybenzoate 3-monooxygenase [Actinomycetota bacterium]|nr:4-hydroxybenzoate 3-monooxygenase [Actinomycetota bacterium]